MNSTFFRQRIEDLEEHVAKAQKLRSEYEGMRDLSDDPRTRARCEKAIEELKTSVNQYYEELEELQQQLQNQEPSVVKGASDQLAHIEADLRVLMGGQIAILGKLDQTRKDLLNHYDANQRHFVVKIAEKLNQNQLQLTQILLRGLEADEIPKAEIEEALMLLEKRLVAMPPAQREVTEVIKDPSLDAKHKLKVCIPIIPLILDYEGEIELGTGFNFRNLWNQIKTRLGR